MPNEYEKVDKKKLLKPFILFFIVVLVVIYVAVPTYGTIRDFLGEGNLTFVLGTDVGKVEIARPDKGVIGKILDYLFPKDNGIDSETNGEIDEKRILNLKGRVVYEGNIPYPNGLIEFLSEPRYTRTDSDGYFYFDNVEQGYHIIRVLDDKGKVLAFGEFEILWDKSIDETKVEISADGTVLFKVEITTVVLELRIVLKKGDKGDISGIDRIELLTDPEDESGGESSTPKPPVKPPGGSGGTTPPEEPSTPPVDPTDPPDEDGDFAVKDTQKSYTEGSASTDIDIFGSGSKKYIAPGSSGKYKFNVENKGNDPYFYTVSFGAINTVPTYIPMEYKLQKDGIYIFGDESTWVSLSAIYLDKEIDAGATYQFILHWHWKEHPDDNDYIQYADNPNFQYILTVKITGQAK